MSKIIKKYRSFFVYKKTIENDLHNVYKEQVLSAREILGEQKHPVSTAKRRHLALRDVSTHLWPVPSQNI